MIDAHHPADANPRPRFWFRVVGMGVIVVLLGFVFLHVYPKAWRITCRPFETRSIDATGRNVSVFTTACLPMSWYFIAGFCGAGSAAAVTLRKITALRLVMFVVLCDLVVTWIAGTALLVWDHFQPHMWADSGAAAFWASAPFTGFFVGVTFGNLFTLGFPLWAGALASFCVLGAERAHLRN
jgi:hypothetical protein